MPSPTPRELKKLLISEGFEVYRTLEDRVILAERVRDNLIMDSGVALMASEPPTVLVALRVQAGDFPGDSPAGLLQRARDLAGPLLGRGYQEVGSAAVPVPDPGDQTQLLDTWYEVYFSCDLSSAEGRGPELTFALEFDKIVPGPDSQ